MVSLDTTWPLVLLNSGHGMTPIPLLLVTTWPSLTKTWPIDHGLIFPSHDTKLISIDHRHNMTVASPDPGHKMTMLVSIDPGLIWPWFHLIRPWRDLVSLTPIPILSLSWQWYDPDHLSNVLNKISLDLLTIHGPKIPNPSCFWSLLSVLLSLLTFRIHRLDCGHSLTPSPLHPGYCSLCDLLSPIVFLDYIHLDNDLVISILQYDHWGSWPFEDAWSLVIYFHLNTFVPRRLYFPALQ